MYIKVVIDMKNSNALIAMALVSQNSNNPYSVFCEYIKYCIFVNDSDTMTISEIKKHVSDEFGLYIPYNIAVKCLSIIAKENIISLDRHQIKRIGSFDTKDFDKERTAYRTTESHLIDALIKYVSKYGRTWSTEHAREQLIKVLDKNGLAYDIFIHDNNTRTNYAQSPVSIAIMEEFLPDEELAETEDDSKQPLFSDAFFVGRFIEQILSADDNNIQKDYLKKVCEGLMLCVGAYQLPSADTEVSTPQIKDTDFFFDTRLLLRFVGCASEAAVDAAKELVNLIQSAGGNILYYPQTFEELNCAFDEAIRSLSCGYPPRDNEMRMYALRIKNSIDIMRAKKASLENEFSNAKIYLRQHQIFTESERIHHGFDQNDLKQYMEQNLTWDLRTIENDVLSIWETHMRRDGNYSEYCGTRARLPVFVTTNSRLLGIALSFKEDRPNTRAISGWKQNRLPVITDIRLTCRLWLPSKQGERLSLLYLTANAVAAQRPTPRYINTIRKLAIEFENNAPDYSCIPLSSFFEDNITNAILEHTHGAEEKLNLGNFASSIAELTEWKVKEQEEKTNQVISERDDLSEEREAQITMIINGAVEANKNKLGISRIVLILILYWPIIVTLAFAAISSYVSHKIGNWDIIWITLIPVVIAGAEMFSSSKFIKKPILKFTISKVDQYLNKRLENSMRPAELQYKDIIIPLIKEKTKLWSKCQGIIND